MDLGASTLLLSLTAIILSGYLVAWYTGQRKRLPLPPGPKGLPILGNVFGVPTKEPWVKYMEWARQFNSDILSFRIFSQTIVIIGSADVARVLLDKRSDVYSDRPPSVMDQLCGLTEWNMVIQPYGPTWRAGRRHMHDYFRRDVIHCYRSTQKREVHAFLRRALDFKGRLRSRAVNQIFATQTMDILYGIPVNGPDDSFVRRIEHANEKFSEMKVPGAFLADTFPVLRHIPAWCPGGAAQRFASEHGPLMASLNEEPFNVVKQDMAHGVNKHRIAHLMYEKLESITDKEERSVQEICARGAAAIAYIAGVETSFSTTSWFIVAMAMHPAAQAKAQDELDKLLGPTRLPELEDRESLPYCQALLMEVLRWRPAVPLSIPHRLMVDDQYEVYHLPAGSLVVPNVWAMLHDPQHYPDPDAFNPDRFLRDGLINPEVPDPAELAFGFGRRICPGRFFAKDGLFLTLTSILSVYDILPAADEVGNPLPVDADSPGAGILLHPRSLENCTLKPRSTVAEALIKRTDVAEETVC